MSSYLQTNSEDQKVSSPIHPPLSAEHVRGDEMGSVSVPAADHDKTARLAGRGQVNATGTGAEKQPINRNAGSVEHGSHKA